MTRTYALKRLLEHGPLRRCELIEFTGWKMRQVDNALDELMYCGIVRSFGPWGSRTYALC